VYTGNEDVSFTRYYQNSIAEYIISDMLPLSTVESPAFKKLVEGISICNVDMPNRKSLALHLEKAYESMMAKLKETLEEVSKVSTTADVWSAHNRNYLGMTVHWINKKSLRRCKAALACTRITGRHTYDVQAENISRLHD